MDLRAIAADLEKREYTAKDVAELAKLSYRQLNVWENAGALPKSRGKAKSGWRKFSFNEIFAIIVCAEIRSRFGVPLELLSWLKSHLLKDHPIRFAKTVGVIKSFGFSLMIMTDLKKVYTIRFLRRSSSNSLGFFSKNKSIEGLLLLKLNPIINRILSYHKAPVELKEHDGGERIVRKIQKDFWQALMAQDQKEMEIFRLIRDKRFKQVKITFKDGATKKITNEASKSDLSLDEMEDVLNSKDYQEVMIKKHNGKFVHLRIKPTLKAIPGRPRQQKAPAPKGGLANNKSVREARDS